MNRLRIVRSLAVVFASTCLTFAAAGAASPAAANDETPAFHGPESASERAFVRSISADLGRRFPTATLAERAGYVRYTDEDETGAVSYANRHWTSDMRHPSQLWYDVHGKLIGADFSRPVTGAVVRPSLWGVNPGRWIIFPQHLHYVSRDASGALRYGRGTTPEDFAAAGGTVHDPQPQTLVRMHKVAAASDVVTLFEFPRIYDLIVWVVPNPRGAFAAANPLVRPSGAKRAGDDVH